MWWPAGTNTPISAPSTATSGVALPSTCAAQPEARFSETTRRDCAAPVTSARTELSEIDEVTTGAGPGAASGGVGDALGGATKAATSASAGARVAAQARREAWSGNARQRAWALTSSHADGRS